MGKKYIIELEDKPFHKGRGDFLYRVKGFNSLVFDMTGIGMLTPYIEPDLEQVRKEAYEEGKKQAKVQAELDVCHDIEKVAKENYKAGLVDAWEAAKKIASDDAGQNHVIFGQHFANVIFNTFTASEAIEKIRQYEQKKEEQIQVGDEVIATSGKAVIVSINDDKDKARYIYHDSTLGFDKVCNLSKTGRHFPEIAAVLEKMRGEQG